MGDSASAAPPEAEDQQPNQDAPNDQKDQGLTRHEFVRSDGDDEMDLEVDQLIEEQKELLEELDTLRRTHGATRTGQNQRVDQIWHRLDYIYIVLQYVSEGYRIPPLRLKRQTWAEYRKEKIDAGVFNSLYRMSPEQFDDLSALLRAQLRRDVQKYAHTTEQLC